MHSINVFSLLLVISVQQIQADSEKLTRLSCEGEELYLDCPGGYTIDVISANYGKLDVRMCRMPGNQVNNCRSGNSLDFVKFKCNRKQMCQITAANHVFGDPCLGTRKYLEVTYECIKGEIRTLKACENDNLIIKCPSERFIWVSHALYGRTNQNDCNVDKDVRANHCYAKSAFATVESRCDNLQECTIPATNGIFGDPCVGTYKYLEVDYQCLDSVGIIRAIEPR